MIVHLETSNYSRKACQKKLESSGWGSLPSSHSRSWQNEASLPPLQVEGISTPPSYITTLLNNNCCVSLSLY
jgi:hypothetical protein